MYPMPEDIAAAADIWALGLIEAKLTPKQIGHGLSKAITRNSYCPDLPGFIDLCRPRPEDFGLPTVQQAYDEACRNAHPTAERNWSHGAVYHAFSQVGAFELRSFEKGQSFPLFQDAYQRTVDAVLNGDPLPEIPKAIEDKSRDKKGINWKPTDEDRAKGRQSMATIMNMLGKRTDP